MAGQSNIDLASSCAFARTFGQADHQQVSVPEKQVVERQAEVPQMDQLGLATLAPRMRLQLTVPGATLRMVPHGSNLPTGKELFK